MLGPDFPDLVALGPFDRVLVYATFHYVRDADQAARLLRRIVDLLRPGGTALIGNLPLVDLAEQAAALRTGSMADRLRGTARWLRREQTAVPRSFGWKVRALAHAVWSRRGRPTRGPAGDAPSSASPPCRTGRSWRCGSTSSRPCWAPWAQR